MTLALSVLPPDAAADPALVDALVGLVNAAYSAGEAGLWRPGTARTDAAEVAGLVRGGGMVVAARDGRIAGCACLRPAATPASAELGFISVAPEAWGTGLGRATLRFAEDLARERGVRTMTLKLLVPSDGTHPDKARLRAWYERLGYAVVSTLPFADVATHGADRLATPCAFLVFRKSLAP